MEYPNFYENMTEAQARLRGTVVMYDKEPYLIQAITSHAPDGIFRVYIESLKSVGAGGAGTAKFPFHHYTPTDPSLGAAADLWLKANPKSEILRKQMNSPKFDKFRPFPLGMCNYEGQCFYLERQPLRPKMEQGLTGNMIVEKRVTAAMSADTNGRQKFGKSVGMYTAAFRDCVTAAHPSAAEVLQKLRDYERVQNEAVAFHRYFAFVRGPIEMMFLAYKGDIVGALPKGDFSRLRLGRHFRHLKEVTQELNLFKEII